MATLRGVMKTKATTIDNFDIKIHERYAQDQIALDKTFIVEPSLISQHFEITGTSSIYASKWEELFELGIRNIPWAAFTPPPRYQKQAKRFFSYRILPTIFVDDEEQDEEEQESEEKKRGREILKKAHAAKKGASEDPFLFERDKTTIINLLQSVLHLNKLLTQVYARKLQYQKG
jgi:hypothetical protein